MAHCNIVEGSHGTIEVTMIVQEGGNIVVMCYVIAECALTKTIAPQHAIEQSLVNCVNSQAITVYCCCSVFKEQPQSNMFSKCITGQCRVLYRTALFPVF